MVNAMELVEQLLRVSWKDKPDQFLTIPYHCQGPGQAAYAFPVSKPVQVELINKIHTGRRLARDAQELQLCKGYKKLDPAS